MIANKTIATQFSCGKETVFAQGRKGFINIMVSNGKKIHDGVAKDIDGINKISNRINNDTNKENFIAWAKEVIS